MRLSIVLVLLAAAACTSPSEPDGVAVAPLEAPAGTRAEGPRLSVGTDGTVVLSWMEPDERGTSLRYSTLDGDRWRPARTVVSGADMFVNWADLPSVIRLDDDHWAAHWLQMAGPLTYSYHVLVSQSFDGGMTWRDPVKPHRDRTPTEHGFVSLHSSENGVAAVWLDGRKTTVDATADPTDSGMTLRAAAIDANGVLQAEQQIDELVCDCCQTDVTVAEHGPLVVYRDRSVNEIRDIHIARHADREWQPGRLLHEDNWHIAGCPVNGPAIASIGSRIAVAWFTAAGQKPAVRLKFSNDSGETFGEPFAVATDGALGHVDSVVLADGSAIVSWLQSNGSGLASLMIRRVRETGVSGPAYTITQTVHPRSVPQLALSGRQLVLAWTESTEGSSRIASARVRVDDVASAGALGGDF